jgi:hypothetical protein
MRNLTFSFDSLIYDVFPFPASYVSRTPEVLQVYVEGDEHKDTNAPQNLNAGREYLPTLLKC